MGKTHEPTKIAPAQRAALLRDEIRQALPIKRYLMLLNQAVTEGRIPDTDALTGKPKGTSTEVPVKDRLAIAQWIVDKVLPNAKELDAPPLVLTRDDLYNLSPEQLRALPLDQLAQILGIATTIDVVKEPDAQQS